MIKQELVLEKAVDRSLLKSGITLKLSVNSIFGKVNGILLKRGESKNITLCIDNREFQAKVSNLNFSSEQKRKKDTFQIRYTGRV